MSIEKELYSKLPKDKIKINFNKNPVPIEKFLSFLTVTTERVHDHLGESSGWTRFENKENKLIVSGGICDGGHWLHYLEYGKNIDNPYNNFINPLQMLDILNDEGKRFFVNYYKTDIQKIIDKTKSDVSFIENQLKNAKVLRSQIKSETDKLFSL